MIKFKILSNGVDIVEDDEDMQPVCECITKSDAKRIVQAVNNHDRLVRTLETVNDWFTVKRDGSAFSDSGHERFGERHLPELIELSLALAKGEVTKKSKVGNLSHEILTLLKVIRNGGTPTLKTIDDLIKKHSTPPDTSDYPLNIEYGSIEYVGNLIIKKDRDGNIISREKV